MAITGVGTSQAFDYIGGIQTFTAPLDGLYEYTLYGAPGGIISATDYNHGGYGGVVRAYELLKKGTVRYICVGGRGNAAHYPNNNGYNGGGLGYPAGGGGGGATHIAKVSGVLSALSGQKANVLLVAGGGGGGVSNGTGGVSYGCNGGGAKTYDGSSIRSWNGSVLRRTDGFSWGHSAATGSGGGSGKFGQGSDGGQYGGGGGGGWYGGAVNKNYTGGGGGSAYTNLPAITHKGVTYSPACIGERSGNQNNGYANIKLVALGVTSNLYFNGTKVENVVFNGAKVNKVICNGIIIYE